MTRHARTTTNGHDGQSLSFVKGLVTGALIGAGGGKGAAIGGVVGAAGGAGVQVLTRGKTVRVPAETVLEFGLEPPVSLHAER